MLKNLWHQVIFFILCSCFVMRAQGVVLNDLIVQQTGGDKKTFLVESWKDNSLVLQNPDMLQNGGGFLLENQNFSIPFVPSFKNLSYPQRSYLQPPLIPLIPNVIPLPLDPSDYTLKEQLPYRKDFIISYQLLIQNEVPTGDKYDISEPLVKKNLQMSYECEIDVGLEHDDEIPEVLDILLKILLKQNKDRVLECLYKSGVKVRDDGVSQKNMSQNKVLFTLPPTYIRAGIEDGYLKLWVLKNP